MNANDAPKEIKAAKIENVKNKPFMMLKNLSDVNECAYEVLLTKLRKPIAGAKVTEVKDEEMKVSKAS